jgi:peptidoglycan/LPS O-acetylase OafA/YrhL
MVFCVAVTTWIALSLGSRTAYYLTFRGGIGLLLGASMGIVLVRRPDAKVLKMLWPTWVGIASCVLLFILAASVHGSAHGGEGLAFPFGGITYFMIDLAAAGIVGHVFVRGQRDSIVTRFLSLRVWVGLGVMSYGIYLFHVPVITLTAHYLKNVSPNWIMVIAPLITVAMAALSFHFVERPIRQGRRKRAAARAQEAARKVESGGPGEIASPIAADKGAVT